MKGVLDKIKPYLGVPPPSGLTTFAPNQGFWATPQSSDKPLHIAIFFILNIVLSRFDKAACSRMVGCQRCWTGRTRSTRAQPSCHATTSCWWRDGWRQRDHGPPVMDACASERKPAWSLNASAAAQVHEVDVALRDLADKEIAVGTSGRLPRHC